jgi:hypothetical protein
MPSSKSRGRKQPPLPATRVAAAPNSTTQQTHLTQRDIKTTPWCLLALNLHIGWIPVAASAVLCNIMLPAFIQHAVHRGCHYLYQCSALAHPRMLDANAAPLSHHLCCVVAHFSHRQQMLWHPIICRAVPCCAAQSVSASLCLANAASSLQLQSASTTLMEGDADSPHSLSHPL